MKKCSQCNDLLSLDVFHQDKRSKDGTRSVCKSCRSKEIIKFKETKNYVLIKSKICTGCKIKKPIDEFTKDSNRKDGHYSQCKACCIVKTAKFYLSNPGYKQLQDHKYYSENKKQIILRVKKWILRKLKTDIHFRLHKNISRAVNRELKKHDKTKNNISVLKYLPYSMKDLKAHLEKQFGSWMTWKNQGKYLLEFWDDNDSTTWMWQLDHIIPQSDLPYSSMRDENFATCWSLENIRPLSAKQNFLDGIKRVRHK